MCACVFGWRVCATDVCQVSEGVNGLLLQQLATITEHKDPECVSFFRQGAPFLGQLPCSGNGTPFVVVASSQESVEVLREQCAVSNAALVGSLREDVHAQDLLKLTRADAKLGRMSEPQLFDDSKLQGVRLAPRFPVVKQNEDGSTKVRPVDNFSWSALKQNGLAKSERKRRQKAASVNGFCTPTEHLHHNHLDAMMVYVQKFLLLVGIVPGLFKADMDSAYRRVPIDVDHIWASGIAFLCGGQIWTSVHNACPFGAVASVHGWERVGALITHIARKVLKLGLFRYVDDFFGCERPETLAHGLSCFCRLVRLLFGQSALSDRKTDYGASLVVLGVEIKLSLEGYECKPAEDKVRKWLLCIMEAIGSGILLPGDASKLAGRLQWACQHMFRKIGRAMLRPLYDQIRCGSGKVYPDLMAALVWWARILRDGISELRCWNVPDTDPVHLFCDAAGEPARVAAVVWVDGKVWYSDCPPPPEVTALWTVRKDQQIMGLELLSIALGLSVFADLLRGRKVIIHSDNTGAECCTRRGSASSFDHCSLIHQMWAHISRLHIFAWICRVPTDDNISDLPSRHEYAILQREGAVFRDPFLDAGYLRSEVWAEFNRKCTVE